MENSAAVIPQYINVNSYRVDASLRLITMTARMSELQSNNMERMQELELVIDEMPLGTTDCKNYLTDY
jgi:hypothetical protein